MQSDHCAPASKAEPGSYLPSPLSLILLAPRLLFAALDSGAGVIRRTLDGSYDQYDAGFCGVCHGHHPGACCAIPESDCPGTSQIQWSGCVGDRLNYQLQITNRTHGELEFTLAPEAFPVTGETVSVSPDKKILAPDKSFTTVVGFTVPESMAGGCYQSKIRLLGAYEQSIPVSLTVRARQCCQGYVEQGDMPTKIRAHHWFHHFQCHQDCFPNVVKKP